MEIISNTIQELKPIPRLYAIMTDRLFLVLALAFSVLAVLDHTQAYQSLRFSLQSMLEIAPFFLLAMAFITSGAVSSIPAALAVYALVRKPVFALYIILGLSGSMLAGYAFQFIAGA